MRIETWPALSERDWTVPIDAASDPNYTGLSCPACKKPVAVIESVTPRVMVLRCPACGHFWKAERAGKRNTETLMG